MDQGVVDQQSPVPIEVAYTPGCNLVTESKGTMDLSDTLPVMHWGSLGGRLDVAAIEPMLRKGMESNDFEIETTL